MDFKEFDKELDELFELANNELKLAEFTGNRVIISPLNDLRNGTEHRSRASKATNDDLKIKELNEAKQHYMRAAYDALQARILFSLDRLKEFQDSFSKIGDQDSIPEFIDVINLSNEIRELIINVKDGRKLQIDFDELRNKANLLDAKLNSFSFNKSLLIEKINKSKRKAKSLIYYSLIGLIVSLAGGLIPIIIGTDKPKDKEIVKQIEELSTIENSLKSLQDYVAAQKGVLENLNTDITSLNQRKEQLESILTIDKNKLDLILKEIDKKNSDRRWLEIIISFLVGVFSSLTVALFFWYIDKKSRQPKLTTIITTKGDPVIKT